MAHDEAQDVWKLMVIYRCCGPSWTVAQHFIESQTTGCTIVCYLQLLSTTTTAYYTYCDYHLPATYYGQVLLLLLLLQHIAFRSTQQDMLFIRSVSSLSRTAALYKRKMNVYTIWFCYFSIGWHWRAIIGRSSYMT